MKKNNNKNNKNNRIKKLCISSLIAVLATVIFCGCGLFNDNSSDNNKQQEDENYFENLQKEEEARKKEEEEREREEQAKREQEEKEKEEAAKAEAERIEKEKKEAEEQARKEQEEKEKAEKEKEEEEKKKQQGEIGDAAFFEKEEPWKYENIEEIKEVFVDLSYWYSEPNSYIKTLAMFEDTKKIISYSSLNFKNKKIYFLGDSITYGSGSTDDGNGNRYNYVHYLQEVLGCKVENVSYPGATIGSYLIGNNIINQADSIKDDADIVIVFGGVNDFISYNYSYGDDFEQRGYYKGDTRYLMNKLREICPDADIFFVTTFRNREQEDKYIPDNIDLDNFMSVQKELSGGYDIHMIDIYKQGFLDNHDDQSYHEFFYDLLHPNNDGSRVLGKYIAGQVIGYYYQDYIQSQEQGEN